MSGSQMSPATKIKLTYDNWQFFPWTKEFEDAEPPVSDDGTFDGNWKRLIDAVESEYDKSALRRYQGFLHAALKLAERLSEFPEVERIALFGSLAKPPFRESYRYKRRIWAFHEPKDIDMAIWLSSLKNLKVMRRTIATLAESVAKKAPGICAGNVELFVFDSKSSKYLGRVCHYKHCPYNDANCRVDGCGKPSHLKIASDFMLYPDAVSRINSQLLFERTSTNLAPASNLYADIPQMLPEELIEILVDSKDVRIERIVSTGHASPPGFWYDQPESEWVVVLHGEAVLEFEDEKRHMVPGDFVLIPPHRKHRVSSTSMKEPTVWLAVFFGKEKKASKRAVKKGT
jgi:cupin 2 domain-containing protein